MTNKYPHLIHSKYRPEIDGLRAVAILSVLLFHAFPGKMPGGFIGVDIFFVISGFLISSIIFSSLEHNRYSIIEFYIRRILRIFPALIVVFVLSLAFGWFVLFEDEFTQLGKHTAASVGFIENFVLWRESDFLNNYFDDSTKTNPLLHLWTLAVEEQFYIFWPLFLVFVWKRQWNFLNITAGIGLVSFAINLYLMQRSPTAAFYLPMSRFWELMIGGMLAYIVLHRPHLIEKYKNWQSILGFILIAIGLILLNESKNFPGWWALLPTMGAFFIISAGSNAWLNKKLLSNKLMVWIGLISYPLYLWHWVLLSYLHVIIKEPSWQINVVMVLFSVILSWLTYEFVEKKIRFSRNKKFATVVLLTVMTFILITGISIWQYPIPARNSNPVIDKILSSSDDWTYPKGLSAVPEAPKGIYELNSKAKDITLFMGDSHIKQYAPRVVYKILNKPENENRVIFAAYGSCPPIPNVFTGWDELRGLPSWANSKKCEDVKNYGFSLLKNSNLKTVVIGMSWDGQFGRQSMLGTPPLYSNYYSIRNGKRYQFIGDIGIPMAIENLNTFIKTIPSKVRVVIILDNPASGEFSPRSLVSSIRLSGGVPALNKLVKIPPKHFDITDKLMNISSHNRVEFIDPTMMFCSGGFCKTTSDSGDAIYKDGNHFTESFIRENALFIDRLITSN